MCVPGRLAIFAIQSFGNLRKSCLSSFVRNISHNRPSAITSALCNQMRHLSISQKHNQPNTSLTNIQLKKRPIRKKHIDDADTKGYGVIAYATAEEYDLERLYSDIVKEDLYQRKEITTDELNDCLYVEAKYVIDDEPREIFFFREGSVVFWNCPELECGNVLKQLAKFEIDGYERNLVQEERDTVSYNYDDKAGAHMKKGTFYLSRYDTVALEKYTFSNAISTSIKLAIWEASLDKYVDSMEYVTEDLKKGRKIKMSRAEVLRKTGELFALRHLINLSSDLLDTPDFYWDRDELEQLYLFTCGYFSIQRRTKVMNEKLNHCVELAELISSNLNDTHHVRLEWMIIWLIVIEVLFEGLHLFDRYNSESEPNEDIH